MTRAHLPLQSVGEVLSASRRLTEARCYERSHTGRCWRVGLLDPDSDPCRRSDSHFHADLKLMFFFYDQASTWPGLLDELVRTVGPGLATRQALEASRIPRHHSVLG